MHILFPPDGPGAAPQQGQRVALRVWIAVGSVLLFAGLCGSLYLLFSTYTGRGVVPIDQSGATFTAESDFSGYQNPKYGVALRLPGQWYKSSDLTGPNVFCTLSAPAVGFGARFWIHESPLPILPSMLGKLSDGVRSGYEEPAGWIVTRDQEVLVNGLRGRLLVVEITQLREKGQLASLLVAKNGVLYQLDITEPSHNQAWDRIWAELPGAMALQ